MKNLYVTFKKLCVKLCFLFVLCLTMLSYSNSADIPVQLVNIKRYVEINTTSNSYIKDVIIDNNSSEKCSILYYYPKTMEKTVSRSKVPTIGLTEEETAVLKLYAFYTGVGCKFAEWTIKKLIDFVKLSQFFQVGKQLSQKKFNEFLNALLGFINSYVVRFINILNKYLDLNSDQSYYTDTTILKTFISLKITTYFLILNNNKDNQKLHKSNEIIIGKLLEGMHAIHEFLSIHCLDSSFDKIIDYNYLFPFFGYWESQTELLDGTVENFLNQIAVTIEFVFDPQRCNETHTLLGNFVTEISSDSISVDILTSKVEIADTNTISIEDILNEIKKSSDIELIYWYQDSVLITIIKRIFYIILNYGQELPGTTIEIINKIYSKIAENRQKLPRKLVDSFRLLSNSVNNIQINTLNNNFTSIDHIILSDVEVDGTKYLDNILEKIHDHIDDFKCFNRSFEHEHDKYYIPFIKNKSTFLSINSNNNIQINDNTCNYVLGVYSKCFRTLKNTIDKYGSNTGQIDKPIRKFEINDILNNSISVIRYSELEYIRDNDLLTMAIDITIILLNLRSHKTIEVFLFKRVLNIIMTRLNYYGIKYCTFGDFSYILYKRIRRIGIESIHELNQHIFTFFSLLVTTEEKTKKGIIVKIEDYIYLDIQYLYDTFIKESEIFKLHGNSITVYWKGKACTVMEIFEDAIRLTLNPWILYTLYDVYFKCQIAVVYHVIFQVMNEDDAESILYRLTEIQSRHFPQELEFIIKNINKLLTLPETKVSDLKEIEIQFGKFNIAFNSNTTYKTSNNNISIINNELRDKVTEFNLLFSKLRNIVGLHKNV